MAPLGSRRVKEVAVRPASRVGLERYAQLDVLDLDHEVEQGPLIGRLLPQELEAAGQGLAHRGTQGDVLQTDQKFDPGESPAHLLRVVEVAKRLEMKPAFLDANEREADVRHRLAEDPARLVPGEEH